MKKKMKVRQYYNLSTTSNKPFYAIAIPEEKGVGNYLSNDRDLNFRMKLVWTKYYAT